MSGIYRIRHLVFAGLVIGVRGVDIHILDLELGVIHRSPIYLSTGTNKIAMSSFWINHRPHTYFVLIMVWL